MRNTDLISYHQSEKFEKGQKEAPHVRLPPRIPLASIHLGLSNACATRKDSESE